MITMIRRESFRQILLYDDRHRSLSLQSQHTTYIPQYKQHPSVGKRSSEKNVCWKWNCTTKLEICIVSPPVTRKIRRFGVMWTCGVQSHWCKLLTMALALRPLSACISGCIFMTHMTEILRHHHAAWLTLCLLTMSTYSACYDVNDFIYLYRHMFGSRLCLL